MHTQATLSVCNTCVSTHTHTHTLCGAEAIGASGLAPQSLLVCPLSLVRASLRCELWWEEEELEPHRMLGRPLPTRGGEWGGMEALYCIWEGPTVDFNAHLIYMEDPKGPFPAHS